MPKSTPRNVSKKKREELTSPSTTLDVSNQGTSAVAVVTPSDQHAASTEAKDEFKPNARRNLFSSSSSAASVTPHEDENKRKSTITLTDEPSAKRRLIFGKLVELKECQPNVTRVYKIVKKLTGSIGGNGYSGPIYGELTMGSMQKMTDLMMQHTNLNETSRFIDVGSGIGKPNLHVAQYPGVEFSCGVEMEHTRWSLGMVSLKAVLDQAMEDQEEKLLFPKEQIRGNCVFLHKNIMEAKTFDPFTHVYMFSIGFPPPLWIELSKMWNTSQSEFLVCYHSPKAIIEDYEFQVELLAQTPTSMHGSKEGHTGYIYRRFGSVSQQRRQKCDKLFQKSWDLVQQPLEKLQEDVSKQVEEIMGSGRRTRRSRQQHLLTRS